MPCREDLCTQLMRERDDIVTRRRKCARDLAALQQASLQLLSLPQELASHAFLSENDVPASGAPPYTVCTLQTCVPYKHVHLTTPMPCFCVKTIRNVENFTILCLNVKF